MSSTDFTANLSLPYLLSNQAQKHVTLNESLRALDGLVQASIISRTETDPPPSPEEGDRYSIAPTATGDWSGQDGKLALFADGGWLFFTPQTGWRLWCEAESLSLVYDGSDWVTDRPDELQNITRLGLGASADASNPCLAKLNALLFTALYDGEGGTGNLYAKLNKEAATDTLSLLFQTGYSTRAEIGLIGNDDVLFKVSPDGSSFYEGIRIDRETGQVSFPNGTDNFRERLTANRDYYVRSDGSDSNTGLADNSGDAFLTIGKALETARALDVNGYDVTIHVGAGTYTEVITLSGEQVGGGKLFLVGDVSTPSNVELNSSSFTLSLERGARLNIGGFRFAGASLTTPLVVSSGAQLVMDGACEFDTSSYSHMTALDPGSTILLEADYEVIGDTGRHFRIRYGGAVTCASITVTLTDTPDFSSRFVDIIELSRLSVSAVTYSGSATGNRYRALSGSLIDTGGGGASFLPGHSAGTTSSGGQYL